MADTDYPITPTAIAVPVLAFITIILDIAPLAWHIRNRNLAASSLVFWVLLPNLMNVINAVIWPTDNTASWWDGSGLCDVEAKLMIALSFVLVASLLCIMRSLARVLDTRRTVLSPSRSQRRQQMIIECLLCFGSPIYSMIAHYIVQPSRYYVFAISGCVTSVDNSWPKLALIYIWPPIMCLVVVYYSVLVIIRMRKYQRDFSDILSSSSSNLTKSRFLRLFILSMTLIAVMLPTQYYVLYRNSAVPLLPYDWSAIHGPDWNTIQFFPSGGTVLFDRWIQIAVGFAIFPFFGLGKDAQVMYRRWLLSMGLGKIFPRLHQQPTRHTSSLTSNQSNSFGSRVRLLFHKRGSVFSLHSHRGSVPASVATLSPIEAQKSFSNLPTISENQGISENPHNMLEKQNSLSPPWLNRFLVKPHFPAPLRSNSSNPNDVRDLERQDTHDHNSTSDFEKFFGMG
ncbi:a-factor receptor [Lecanora helva]